MQILALIPARGGSKSIPRKNIRPLAGFPLIAYSIAAALQAKLVSRTVVSTDDEEIARIARAYGAETPFLRPTEYAQDNTTDLPVFTHTLSWLMANENYQPDIVVQLRPTSPLRPPDCVDQAVQSLLDQPDAPEPFNAPRQVLPQTYWQTGHIDAIRLQTILGKSTLSGDVIYPLLMDPRYAIDIDTLRDWRRAEWLISQGDLPMVHPGHSKRPLPKQVDLLVMDFDGVMTDDRVWVDQDGRESVAANRRDGMGITALHKAGIPMIVLSTEPNSVVAARCYKLNLPVIQGLSDKSAALRQVLQERHLDYAHVVYLGNDINDLPCFPLVGCAVVVSDAHPDVITQADVVLSCPGGHGAVRELCDRILQNQA
jgi:YrbI family 3-deoxy-D-manno-octulosonate 8-phosphate phosphatase